MLHNDPEETPPTFLEYISPSKEPSKPAPREFDTSWMDEDMKRALHLALMDTPLLCPQCEAICDEHVVRIRDMIIRRAEWLLVHMLKAIDLYKQMREFGIAEPGELLDNFYMYWENLTDLHAVSEPQDGPNPHSDHICDHGDDVDIEEGGEEDNS